eukprot:gene20058-24056_t
MHVVADIFCVQCSEPLGWKYEFAKDDSQKYKAFALQQEQSHALILQLVNQNAGAARTTIPVSPDIRSSNGSTSSVTSAGSSTTTTSTSSSGGSIPVTPFSLYPLLPQPKLPKIIITMDGGGFRGLTTIQILEYIETTLKIDVGKIGDLYAGTSTGGILSFGKLNNLSNKELDRIYKELGTKVLPMKWKNLSRTGTLSNSTLLKNELTNTFSTVLLQDFAQNKKCFVTTCGKKNGLTETFVPLVLSNYPNELRKSGRGSSVFSGMSVVDALRCTSAVPMLFESPKYGDYQFVDGGIRNNNATKLAMEEAFDLWDRDCPLVIISFGTGRYTKETKGKDGQQTVSKVPEVKKESSGLMKKFELLQSSIAESTAVLKSVLDVTNSHRMHKEFKEVLSVYKNIEYYRFDPPLSKEVSLKDYGPKTIEQMANDTSAYLKSDKFRKKLNNLKARLISLNKL